jgi:hypothetical protein
MNARPNHNDQAMRDRYVSELQRLRTQDKLLASTNDYRYEARLMRSLREVEERIDAVRVNQGRERTLTS